MTTRSITVVGAGFSGTLLSLHLLRHCLPDTRVVLIERNARFGCGQAYATGNPSHLLNVPAGRMSAFHDRPDDFLDWLHRTDSAGCDAAPTAACFVPRRVYGGYVRDLLKQEIRRAPRRRLELVRGEVTGLDRSGPTLRLQLDRGREIESDLAVLAVGNFPPAPMPVADPAFYDGPSYRPDPWAPEALTGLDPADPVLLIGTGLTTVDVVVSLLDQGHRGPIHALSRRGLLPRRHSAGPTPPGEARELPTGLLDLLRLLRREARAAAAAGAVWQPVVDQLRPFSLDVWQTMSMADKLRFLRHLRPWWEVHRHRMPGPVADRIEAARARSQLHVRAGRIRAYAAGEGAIEVEFCPKGGTAPETLRVARVINCSGPGADYDRIAHPLVRSLLAEGTARPDPLRLGLDVTANCALLGRTGAISRRVFAVGPVTKAAFWEMTAVPDIRRQCEVLAQHLAGLLKAMPAPPRPAAKAFEPAA